MKTKTDFVTNSSSSSFVIATEHLTMEQITMIHDHIETALMIEKKHPNIDFGYPNHRDAWTITELNGQISGNTIMDNFDMMGFLQFIGVPMDLVEYDHS